MKAQLTGAWTLLMAWMPTILPHNEADLTAWVDSVLALAGYPVNPSTRRGVASIVMNTPPSRINHSKRYYVKALHRAAMMQCAFYIIEDAKKADKDARDAKASNTSPVQSPAAQVVPQAE